MDLIGGTIGIAFVGTMCNSNLATGVTQDGLRDFSNVVTTAAHELGHNFNMDHDDGKQSSQC